MIMIARKSIGVTAAIAVGIAGVGQSVQARPVAEETAKSEAAVTTEPALEKDVAVTTVSSEAIPFDPPLVLRGWSSQDRQMLWGPLRRPVQPLPLNRPRDLLFRAEDRQLFKAIHPFLLTRPQPVPVIQTPRFEPQNMEPQNMEPPTEQPE